MKFSGVTADDLGKYLKSIHPPAIRDGGEHGKVPWAKDLFLEPEIEILQSLEVHLPLFLLKYWIYYQMKSQLVNKMFTCEQKTLIRNNKF